MYQHLQQTVHNKIHAKVIVNYILYEGKISLPRHTEPYKWKDQKQNSEARNNSKIANVKLSWASVEVWQQQKNYKVGF